MALTGGLIFTPAHHQIKSLNSGNPNWCDGEGFVMSYPIIVDDDSTNFRTFAGKYAYENNFNGKGYGPFKGQSMGLPLGGNFLDQEEWIYSVSRTSGSLTSAINDGVTQRWLSINAEGFILDHGDSNCKLVDSVRPY
jgi:hypothetical protein